jgi:hypothetical protein
MIESLRFSTSAILGGDPRQTYNEIEGTLQPMQPVIADRAVPSGEFCVCVSVSVCVCVCECSVQI